jgi:hypothetical protein
MLKSKIVFIFSSIQKQKILKLSLVSTDPFKIRSVPYFWGFLSFLTYPYVYQ